MVRPDVQPVRIEPRVPGCTHCSCGGRAAHCNACTPTVATKNAQKALRHVSSLRLGLSASGATYTDEAAGAWWEGREAKALSGRKHLAPHGRLGISKPCAIAQPWLQAVPRADHRASRRAAEAVIQVETAARSLTSPSLAMNCSVAATSSALAAGRRQHLQQGAQHMQQQEAIIQMKKARKPTRLSTPSTMPGMVDGITFCRRGGVAGRGSWVGAVEQLRKGRQRSAKRHCLRAQLAGCFIVVRWCAPRPCGRPELWLPLRPTSAAQAIRLSSSVLNSHHRRTFQRWTG